MANAIMSETTKLIFGQADITFGTDNIGLQADKAVFKAEPKYADIELYDFGGVVDKICTGWNVTLEVVMAEETAIKLAIPVKEQVDGTTPTKKNYVDNAVGMSLRTAAKELIIHPRNAGASLDTDITIFKAAPTGSFERVYGLEQGKVAITFTAFVKDGAEAGKSGNYFQYGPDVTVAP